MYTPSALRMLLIVICTHSLYVATSSPTRAPQQHERAAYRKRGPMDVANAPRVPIILAFQLFFFGISALEASHIATTLWTQSANNMVHSSLTVPTEFAVGTIMIVTGTCLRVVCYRTLGRHFTFDMSLQEDHKLVTHGPYAIIRHPSYSGILLVFIGVFLTQLGPSSHWNQVGKWESFSGQLIGSAYIALLSFMIVAVFGRINKEDVVLRETFKDQWQQWAKRTPYRLIPFVY
ncbi:hypothetical protein NM688_g2504 [Phlebia brevispora]|uniref:Uncharacterized protein n=1 Tax=Phlebia brevispora TaxID=194682 RepID=A0ACC1T8B2_9APHY|nr:hypothetical protein NM688_g2504 [Phlebia brevispora]